MTLILRGGRIACPATGREAGPRDELDVEIEGGRIRALSPAEARPPPAKPGVEVVDVRGCWVLPGAVDIGVYLREPGREEEEPLATTLDVAARGGFTTVVGMPWTDPVVDGGEGVAHLLSAARGAPAHLAVVGALTRRGKGDDLADLGEMREEGAVLFAADLARVTDALLRRALEYAATFDRAVLLEPSGRAIAPGAAVAESAVSTRLGLDGSPAAGEAIGTFRAVEMARLTGARVIVGPLSTARAGELVAGARAEGLPVTGFVHAWALALDERLHLERPYDTSLRLEPPLRGAPDRAGLRRLVETGALFVASGHRPSSPVFKEVEFDRAEPGASALGTALALLADPERVGLSPLALARATSQGPLAAFGPRPPAGLLGEERGPAGLRDEDAAEGLGRIEVGCPAVLTVFDPAGTTRVAGARLGRSRFHPLAGSTLAGRARGTVVGGRFRPAPDDAPDDAPDED